MVKSDEAERAEFETEQREGRVARKMVLDLLQNGSGSVLKSRFRLSFKRWVLLKGL